MHDYTVRLIHEDRMRQLEHEADASALAAMAKSGRQRPAGAGLWTRVSTALTSFLGRGNGDPEANSLSGRFGTPVHTELGEDV